MQLQKSRINCRQSPSNTGEGHSENVYDSKMQEDQNERLLIEPTSKPKSSNRVRKIVCFISLNICSLTVFRTIGISLSEIGFKSISLTNGLLSLGDVIGNSLMVLFGDKMPRKKTLVWLNLVLLGCALCLIVISFCEDFYETRVANMALSFIMKGTNVAVWVIAIMFGSK